MGKGDHGPGHRHPVHRGRSPEAGKDRGQLEPGQGGQCARFVQRRQADHPVGQELDKHSACADDDERPEQRVADEPDRELYARRYQLGDGHGRTDAGDPVVCLRGCFARGDAQDDAACLGLVGDGLAGLHHDREAKLLRRRDG